MTITARDVSIRRKFKNLDLSTEQLGQDTANILPPDNSGRAGGDFLPENLAKSTYTGRQQVSVLDTNQNPDLSRQELVQKTMEGYTPLMEGGQIKGYGKYADTTSGQKLTIPMLPPSQSEEIMHAHGKFGWIANDEARNRWYNTNPPNLTVQPSMVGGQLVTPDISDYEDVKNEQMKKFEDIRTIAIAELKQRGEWGTPMGFQKLRRLDDMERQQATRLNNTYKQEVAQPGSRFSAANRGTGETSQQRATRLGGEQRFRQQQQQIDQNQAQKERQVSEQEKQNIIRNGRAEDWYNLQIDKARTTQDHKLIADDISQQKLDIQQENADLKAKPKGMTIFEQQRVRKNELTIAALERAAKVNDEGRTQKEQKEFDKTRKEQAATAAHNTERIQNVFENLIGKFTYDEAIKHMKTMGYDTSEIEARHENLNKGQPAQPIGTEGQPAQPVGTEVKQMAGGRNLAYTRVDSLTHELGKLPNPDHQDYIRRKLRTKHYLVIDENGYEIVNPANTDAEINQYIKDIKMNFAKD